MDRPRLSLVACGVESGSGCFHPSFHRVRRCSDEFHPVIYKFMNSIHRVGRSREYNHLVDSGQIKLPHSPLGYWRASGLWPSLGFAGQPLKDCVNVIHTGIVEIWDLKVSANVSSSQSLCWFSSLTENSLFLAQHSRERCSTSSKTWVGRLPAYARGVCFSREIIEESLNF